MTFLGCSTSKHDDGFFLTDAFLNVHECLWNSKEVKKIDFDIYLFSRIIALQIYLSN